ncbi:iron complex transport system substrate-binding protein [Halanaerobium saccharolyticum]|jgi:iron complex transport system substrate-binding protein|uniref:Iron complex transport system substrate-binding protein n=1 Tax=Halanaerobium saccharolyticum TaxID=43595 RepID=A0A4R7ZBI3_9FIRM|nr:ABC transporter substrate-binding protein [Halanaerobium saccharolyticum]RAK11845.1 iron complex transport system substrate-binding protein [Halanaerobium saccharolyticum]TDW07686.1 iron complex transport system substrate-binding protein [Halanaerobium saccharolyticum]TDX64607.1 iron complex transport system substrate-binding protein [Halanaerobium saccharolyticum]
MLNRKKKKRTLKIGLLILSLSIFLLLVPTVKIDAARNFTDMIGREITVPEEVNRVVTTYKSATQFVLALNAGDKLVGVSIKTDKQPLFVNLQPELADLPQVGSKRNGINLETTMSVDPDLVILYPHRDAVETAEKLEEQGVTALVINPESLEQIRETTELLGEVLNKEEKAAKVLAAYDKIDSLTERTAALPEAEKKKIYFANSEFTDSVGAGMMQTALIENAGGINPAAKLKSGFITVSAENILEWNPELIIVSQFFNGDLENLTQEDKYQNVKAFKNNVIYRVPSRLEPWDFPSPSTFIAQLWLAQKTYSSEYQDLNYQKEVNDFYQTLYGKSFEELGGEF